MKVVSPFCLFWQIFRLLLPWDRVPRILWDTIHDNGYIKLFCKILWLDNILKFLTLILQYTSKFLLSIYQGCQTCQIYYESDSFYCLQARIWYRFNFQNITEYIYNLFLVNKKPKVESHIYLINEIKRILFSSNHTNCNIKFCFMVV